MDQFEGQASNDPRDYEWAEFNLPAELRDVDEKMAQAVAQSSSLNAD